MDPGSTYPGHNILDPGIWVCDPAFRILFWTLGLGPVMMDPGSWIQDPGSGILDPARLTVQMVSETVPI